MNTDIPMFDPREACVKCGHIFFSCHWSKVIDLDERLYVTCHKCGYSFIRRPLDYVETQEAV